VLSLRIEVILQYVANCLWPAAWFVTHTPSYVPDPAVQVRQLIWPQVHHHPDIPYRRLYQHPPGLLRREHEQAPFGGISLSVAQLM
jgi:hypothetical protein